MIITSQRWTPRLTYLLPGACLVIPPLVKHGKNLSCDEQHASIKLVTAAKPM